MYKNQFFSPVDPNLMDIDSSPKDTSEKNCPKVITAYLNHDKETLERSLNHSPSCVLECDENGCSLLHHAALNNDEKLANRCLECNHSIYNDYVRTTTNDGQTAADLAYQKGHKALAYMLYAKELRTSPLHLQIKKYFKNQKKTLTDTDTTQMEHHKKTLFAEMERLFTSQHIQLDDERRQLIGEKRSLKLESKTILGKIEDDLRSMLKRNLKDFIEKRIEADEASVEAENEARQEAYYQKCTDFDPQNGDYDNDGQQVEPEEPQFLTFDRADYGDLNDLGNLIERTEIEPSVLCNILYNDFVTLDALDDIKDALDCSKLKLDRHVINFVFARLDPQFYDLDVMKKGFIVDVMKVQLEAVFANFYYDYEIDTLVQASFKALVQDTKTRGFTRAYNQAAASQDLLELQRNWMRITPLLALDIEADPANIQKKVKQKKYQEEEAKIGKAYKIYPTDKTQSLFYPAKCSKKQALQPLEPLFSTLRTAGHRIKEAIDKAATDEKTNVITAILSLVVSNEPHVSKKTPKQQSKHSRIFINIPLVFKYPNAILSKDLEDGVFDSNDAFHRSVGEDQQQGSIVMELACDTEGLENKKQDSLDAATRLIETVDGLSPEENATLHTLLVKTRQLPLSKTGKYVAEFELKSEVGKTTETYHSERVIFHALKQPQNIQTIIEVLTQKLSYTLDVGKLKLTGDSLYKVYSGALIMASTPNTVCKECSRGVIAMQNSDERGFLNLLVKGLNKSGQFKTRGYDAKTQKQDFAKFAVTTVVVAEKAFDSQALTIEKQPESKLSMKFDPKRHLKKHTIDLRFSEIHGKRNMFYEYIKTNAAPSSAPHYEGPAYMSGSITSKQIDRTKINQIVRDILTPGKGCQGASPGK